MYDYVDVDGLTFRWRLDRTNYLYQSAGF